MVNTIARGCQDKKEDVKQVRSDKSLNIVHQNMRSLWGKCEDLEILLTTEIYNAEVLCFTEHGLNCHKVHTIKINNFMLGNAFCRTNSDHGGSCILVKQGIITKRVTLSK